MGVVYKLREDVVEAIVQMKKEDPSLSCRKLTAMVNQRFEMSLSKSSINDILKDFQLSSPVGRRSRVPSTTAKKFKIPEYRKKELFSPERGPLQEFSPSVTAVKESQTDIEQCENMGLVILKAVELFLAGPEHLLQKHLPELRDEPLAIDMLEFAWAYGLRDIRSLENFHKKAVWDFWGGDKRTALKRLKNLDIDVLSVAQGFRLDEPAIVSECSYYGLEDSQSRRFYVSGNGFFLSKRLMEKNDVVPKKRFLSNIRRFYFNREEILSFGLILADCFDEWTLKVGLNQFFEDIKYLMSILSDKNGVYLKKIKLSSGTERDWGEEIRLLRKRRSFIGGVPAESSIVQHIKKYFFHKSDIQEVFIQNQLFKYTSFQDGGEFYILFDEKAPFSPGRILVTNIEEGLHPQAIGQYCKNFLNIHSPIYLESSDSVLVDGKDLRRGDVAGTDFFGLGEMVLRFLNNYAVQRVFSSKNFTLFEDMFKHFYSLQGRLERSEEFYRVSLVSPKAEGLERVLSLGLEKLNSYRIKAQDGRLLVFSVA